jgi:acyl carrier protein
MNSITNKDEIQSKVLAVVQKHVTAGTSIELEHDLINDLKFDSLNTIEVVMGMEDAFGIEIPEDDIPKLKRVQDVIDYVNNKLNS